METASPSPETEIELYAGSILRKFLNAPRVSTARNMASIRSTIQVHFKTFLTSSVFVSIFSIIALADSISQRTLIPDKNAENEYRKTDRQKPKSNARQDVEGPMRSEVKSRKVNDDRGEDRAQY